jgi:hypothetical protein
VKRKYQWRLCLNRNYRDDTQYSFDIILGGCHSSRESNNIFDSFRDKDQNTIYYSSDRCEPFVDFVFRQENAYYLVQATLGKTHSASRRNLKTILENLQLKNDQRVVVIYAVPDYHFCDFITGLPQFYDITDDANARIIHAKIPCQFFDLTISNRSLNDEYMRCMQIKSMNFKSIRTAQSNLPMNPQSRLRRPISRVKRGVHDRNQALSTSQGRQLNHRRYVASQLQPVEASDIDASVKAQSDTNSAIPAKTKAKKKKQSNAKATAVQPTAKTPSKQSKAMEALEKPMTTVSQPKPKTAMVSQLKPKTAMKPHSKAKAAMKQQPKPKVAMKPQPKLKAVIEPQQKAGAVLKTQPNAKAATKTQPNTKKAAKTHSKKVKAKVQSKAKKIPHRLNFSNGTTTSAHSQFKDKGIHCQYRKKKSLICMLQKDDE